MKMYCISAVSPD